MEYMATITIPKKLEKELKSVSQKLGVSREDLLLNAILYYLQILEKKIQLKEELEAWERTSDFDLLKFEKKI
jgi:metal-responsive CopG/Arc/MetJ family transcriptional regulator